MIVIELGGNAKLNDRFVIKNIHEKKPCPMFMWSDFDGGGVSNLVVMIMGSSENAVYIERLTVTSISYMGVHAQQKDYASAIDIADFSAESRARHQIVKNQLLALKHPWEPFLKRRINEMLKVGKKISLSNLTGRYIVEKSRQAFFEAEKLGINLNATPSNEAEFEAKMNFLEKIISERIE